MSLDTVSIIFFILVMGFGNIAFTILGVEEVKEQCFTKQLESGSDE